MNKIIAIVAALFTAALIALVYHRGYWGDTLCVSASVFAAVYGGLHGWKKFL